MKTFIYKCFLLIAILPLLLLSCKDVIDLAPEDSFGQSNFWQNEAQTNNFMVGLHTQFRNNQFQFLRLGELRSGLSTVEIFPVSLNEVPLLEQRLDENNSGVTAWGGFYPNILQINLFIQKVGESSFLSSARKNYLLGQAHAMRAYYYFHLLRTYGGVPIVLDPVVAGGVTDPLSLQKARSSEAEVLAAVKADVNQSVAYFGTAPASNKGQWSPSAALMLKGEVWLWSAKVYGNTADLAEAKSTLTTITGFSLLPNFADVFSYTKKKNAEIIFAITFAANEAQMSMASQFLYDLPGLSGGFYADSLASGPLISTNPDPLNATGLQRFRYKFELFQSYEKNDSRKLATFFELYKVNKTTTPYTILSRNTVLLKFLGTFENNIRYFSDDWPVYREADRLLMLAEIVNAEGGDPTDYISQVRNRAFGGAAFDPQPFVNGSKDANELAIFTERSKEFVHEGKRWYDLRRMKLGSEPLAFKSTAHPYGVLNKATEAYKVLWPVDPDVWTRDPLVNQTPGYSTTKP